MEWRVVQSHPRYEVSDEGDVRHRKLSGLRRQWEDERGYKTVTLRNPGESSKRLKVHRIVAGAFLENPKSLPFVRHLNDTPGDNRVSNLAWGNNAQNQGDSLRNGTHFSGRVTHCPSGHEYTGDNTAIRGRRKARFCKQCDRDTHARNRSVGLPPDDPRHGKPTTRGNWGCNCTPCADADRERLKRYNKRS